MCQDGPHPALDPRASVPLISVFMPMRWGSRQGVSTGGGMPAPATGREVGQMSGLEFSVRMHFLGEGSLVIFLAENGV